MSVVDLKQKGRLSVRLFGRNGKKQAKSKSAPEQATESFVSTASVAVFANLDKIERTSSGQETWREFIAKVTYPTREEDSLDGRGVVITAPDDASAMKIRDEINAIMGMRRAAKFVARDNTISEEF